MRFPGSPRLNGIAKNILEEMIKKQHALRKTA
jgi:hypothetical protein